MKMLGSLAHHKFKCVCLLLALAIPTYGHVAEPRGADQPACLSSAREKELFDAIRLKDSGRVKALLAAGVSPNARADINYESYESTRLSCATALMHAARLGDLKTVEMLLAAKADVNAADSVGRYVWGYAVGFHTLQPRLSDLPPDEMNVRLQIVKALLKAGAQPDLKDPAEFPDWWSETALFHAAAAGLMTGDLRILKTIIAAGATVKGTEVMAYVTRTAQREAWGGRKAPGAAEVVKTLLAAGANVDGDSYGDKALMMEAYGWELEGVVERMRILLSAGADANAQNKNTGQTALLTVLNHRSSGYYEKPTIKEQTASRARAEIVKLLLAAGADPNKSDKAGDSPLPVSFNACWLENYSEGEIIIKALIAAGADLNSRDKEGRPILSLAASQVCHPSDGGASLRLVKTLIAAGADVNAPDKEKQTPLWFAVSWGTVVREEIVKALIAAGADVNLPTNKGVTPLMAAITSSHMSLPQQSVALVRLLVEAKADVNAKTPDGDTALMLAVSPYRDASLGQALIAAGANVNLTNNSGDTALIIAARSRREDAVIKMLLAAGANVNATNNDGDTALIAAAKEFDIGDRRGYGDIDVSVFNALIAGGANVEILNHEGESALTVMVTKAGPDGLPFIRALLAANRRERPRGYPRAADLLIAIRRAAGRSKSDIVQEMIAAGADVNGVDESGKPALIVAAGESGNASVVRALLAAGARVNARDKNGDTALIVAVREYLPGGNELVKNALHRDTEVIRALLEAKADTGARDKEGNTALALAKKSGNQNVIDLLKKAKARR